MTYERKLQRVQDPLQVVLGDVKAVAQTVEHDDHAISTDGPHHVAESEAECKQERATGGRRIRTRRRNCL